MATSRVAQGGFVVAGSVVPKREISGNRVAGAVEIVKEDLVTDGGVIVHIVVTKRLLTEGGDTAGGCVDRFAGKSGGLETHGCVASAHDVPPKCSLSHRHVLRAAGIGKECFITDGALPSPMLFRSAPWPTATFWLPGLFAARAKAPTAVFALWEMFP